MTSPFKFLSQAELVVDFSIENNPKITRLVADGLMARGKVNDGESAHTQCCSGIAVDSFVVRPPMGEAFIHALHQGEILFPEDAVDSTHCWKRVFRQLGSGAQPHPRVTLEPPNGPA